MERYDMTTVSVFEQLRTRLLSQQWFNTLLYGMPRPVRWALRAAYFAPLDFADYLSGRRDPIIPPRRINFTGAVTDLQASREQLKQRLISMAGLNPTSRVLELGCGFGRLGIPLSTCLDKDGLYEGIDIVRSAIDWCNHNVRGEHNNIKFIHADIYNGEYNPRGRIQPSEYRFPFEDSSFDLVVLMSVFTHMLPTEVDHYLSEIARVLQPGGRCFATYSIITERVKVCMTEGVASLDFKLDLGTHWLMNTSTPELGVAYEEGYLRALYNKHGLDFEFHPGGWSEGLGTGNQDVVVAHRM
jgi:SAM-dependent methyltransferase